MNEQHVNTQQIQQASNAGLTILRLDSTMIPASLTDHLPMLKMILQGLATGQLALHQPEPQGGTVPAPEPEPAEEPQPAKPARKSSPKR